MILGKVIIKYFCKEICTYIYRTKLLKLLNQVIRYTSNLFIQKQNTHTAHVIQYSRLQKALFLHVDIVSL